MMGDIENKSMSFYKIRLWFLTPF